MSEDVALGEDNVEFADWQLQVPFDTTTVKQYVVLKMFIVKVGHNMICRRVVCFVWLLRAQSVKAVYLGGHQNFHQQRLLMI